MQVWLATLTLTACTSRARALAAVLVRSIAPPHYAVSPVCLRELTLLKLPVLCYKHRRATLPPRIDASHLAPGAALGDSV